MFGYVKVFKPELKMKDFELYRGVYCSLCKTLGKHYGAAARISLNYDFTFLAMVRMSLRKNTPEFTASRCSYNPSKKCLQCTEQYADLEYAAAVSMLVVYHKVKDNMRDGNLLKKIGMVFPLPLVSAAYRKAEKKYPELADFLKQEMQRQTELEEAGCASIDRIADITAKSLSYIMAYGFEGEEKEILERFGYCLGRLVYLFDAADDLEKDRKSKAYNPFLLQNENTEEIRREAEPVILFTMDETAKAYELLDKRYFKDIIDNVIYYGFDDTLAKVLKKEGCIYEKSV